MLGLGVDGYDLTTSSANKEHSIEAFSEHFKELHV